MTVMLYYKQSCIYFGAHGVYKIWDYKAYDSLRLYILICE